MQQSFPQQLGVWGQVLRGNFSGNSNAPRLPLAYVADGGIPQWQPQPWHDNERVLWDERTREVTFTPTVVRRGWPIACIDIPNLHLGIIERFGASLVVDALNANGVPVATFHIGTDLPGPMTIVHPDPNSGELELRGYLRANEISQVSGDAMLSGILESQMPGSDLVPWWATDAFGWASRFSDRQHLVVSAASRVRLWVSALADVSNTWRVRATGRIGGYAQRRGDADAALRSARRA